MYEKLQMYEYCKRGVKSLQERRYIWLRATGALNAMLNNPNYYWQIIAKQNKSYPNANLYQIEVDLNRTFPEEPFY